MKEQELTTISDNIEEGKRTLADLQQQRTEAILNWLTEHDKDMTFEPVKIEKANRQVVISSFCFGTFIAEYPLNVVPGYTGQTKVIFTPASFSDKFLNGRTLKIGPERYSRDIKDIVEILDFEPADFEMGEWRNIDFQQSEIWTWKTNYKIGPKEAEFDIIFGAKLENLEKIQRIDKEISRLPIKIKTIRKPSLWYKISTSPLFVAFVVALLSLSGGIIGGIYIEKYKAKRINR